MKIIKHTFIIAVMYIVTWSVVYSIILEFDFSLYFLYLWYSWTSPGEVPSYIQIIALTVTFVAYITYLIFRRLRTETRR